MLAPASVEDITDGILASVDITRNLDIFIGSNPAIYVNKSLGVPGIKIILPLFFLFSLDF